ncbi:MAG: PBP1A family penicillin-binding protein [Alphaproteobacteria bacterium]|nr:MAG: PBP1A family penicillin-binding protein [Alphaproteobacteria bacterium]
MRSLLLRKGRERPSAPRTFASARRARPTPLEVKPRTQVTGTRAFRPRLRHAIAAALALLIILPVAYVAYCIATMPSDGGLVIEPTPSALIVEAADGQVFATRGVFKGDKLAAQDVPANLSRAIVAIEDRHFYEHHGFYFPSMLRAAIRNVISGTAREGGSTITQQLARMTYLSPERTIKRKVQEAVLALWMERHLGKEEILSRYLNTAYFGAGVYGVDAAAKRYFGKTAKELSLSEAAMLAGLVRSPSALAPTRHLESARQRAALVLKAMVETGAISREQAQAARQQPATLRVPPDNPPGTNYFVDMLGSDVKQLIGAPSKDLTLRSTLDLNLQSIAESIIARRLKAEGRAKRVDQAALVAMTPDGAILAMVGGRDYTESQFNRATQAKRQPGSLFKVFVYLAAFQKGLDPQMTAVDRPVQIGKWEPENYGGRFHGVVTLRTAFAHSINSVAVQIADAIGIRAVIDVARKLGVQSELPAVPSLALGAGEVTLLEMTRAFAAIAANAERVESYAIRNVRNGDQVLFTRQKPPLQPASNPAARAAMHDVLASVVREGTARAAKINVPAEGKTGTSQSYKDAWFVGFTDDIVVGVWVGNDDNTPTRGVTGGDLPARIWNEFVTQSAAVRAKSVRAQPRVAALSAPAAGDITSAPSAGVIRGVPIVQTTGMLEIAGHVLRLFGVEGARGRPAREFTRYLGNREVACEPAGSGNDYRCRVGDQDLSRVVLFNGGGRAAANATADLRALEQQARASRVGIWSGREEDDD